MAAKSGDKPGYDAEFESVFAPFGRAPDATVMQELEAALEDAGIPRERRDEVRQELAEAGRWYRMSFLSRDSRPRPGAQRRELEDLQFHCDALLQSLQMLSASSRYALKSAPVRPLPNIDQSRDLLASRLQSTLDETCATDEVTATNIDLRRVLETLQNLAERTTFALKELPRDPGGRPAEPYLGELCGMYVAVWHRYLPDEKPVRKDDLQDGNEKFSGPLLKLATRLLALEGFQRNHPDAKGFVIGQSLYAHHLRLAKSAAER